MKKDFKITRRNVLNLGVMATLGAIILPHVARGILKEEYDNNEKPLVILLGDSIRMNYQETVEKMLKNKATVWAPKENCQDSVFILNNLKKWLQGKTPDVIHLNCGLHDIVIENGKPRRTTEAYAENLNIIFSELRKEFKNTQIIFALTTPVSEDNQKTSETYGRLVRRNSDVDSINEAAIVVCNKYHITIDDLHSSVIDGGVENLICEDGVHLNEKGKKYVGKRVSRYIEDIIDQ